MEERKERCIRCEKMRVGDLKHGFGNPRKITKKKAEELERSLEMFGDFGIFLIPMWDFIIQYWAEWAFGLLGTAVIAVAIKYKALLDGVLAILHDRIYQACQHYIQQGYIDMAGLKNLEYLYRSYHALGGNGTGTELFNRAKALPIHDN